MSGFDLLDAGRPSVDVMFSGSKEWPVLGRAWPRLPELRELAGSSGVEIPSERAR